MVCKSHEQTERIWLDKEKKLNYQIRELKPDEYRLLEDFIYEAIFQPDDKKMLPRSIISKPEIMVYIDRFGVLPDDYCLCAEVEGKVIGAVWVRNISGYGSIDNKTPEFSISLFKEYRGQGIGSELMDSMIEYLRRSGYSQASLAVQKKNYAARMYRKLGFEIVGETDQEYIMKIMLK